ncbi:MAG: TolC family protein [Gammaproteobacteria bacterium]|nr:TolC family protein [Gammaproteobacteria bacterium]
MVKRSLIALLLSGLTFQAGAEPLTMELILQKVVNHYPSLKIASMQVEKASKESSRVNSQFGWQLSGESGLSHQTSMSGPAVNQVMVGGGAARKLSSGDMLTLSGSLSRDNITDSYGIPVQMDPATNLSLKAEYRRSLGRGADNLDYQLANSQAEVGTKMAQAQERLQYDQLASQILGLYLQAVSTHKQIDNVKASIKHSQRLDKFVKSRLGLGISESKDELQVDAQLKGLKARLKGLQLQWVQQEVSLNRLMGLPWDTHLEIELASTNHLQHELLESYVEEAIGHSPELVLIDSELKLAETAIKTKGNNRKDTFDLVGFVGNRFASGDTALGSTSITEPQIGIRIEYKKSLDHSGYDAELSQAYLDRSIALQKREDAKETIHYNIASLLAEIKESKTAYKAAQLSMQSEQAKLTEAEQRYRRGRIEIDRLIQFESQLTESKLVVALQQVELTKREQQLNIVRGAIWKNIDLPQYDWSAQSGDGQFMSTAK